MDPIGTLANVVAALAGLVGQSGALVDQLTSVTPLEALAIGGSGAVSVGVVRKLVQIAAPTGGSSPPDPTATSNVSTTATGPVRGGKSNVAFTLPAVFPVSKGIRKVTHNEIHAIELGIAVGIISSWLYDAGHTKPVFGILVAFVAGSLGYKRYSSKAFKTIRLEPWYALLALLVGGVVGWSIFMWEPELLTVFNF